MRIKTIFPVLLFAITLLGNPAFECSAALAAEAVTQAKSPAGAAQGAPQSKAQETSGAAVKPAGVPASQPAAEPASSSGTAAKPAAKSSATQKAQPAAGAAAKATAPAKKAAPSLKDLEGVWQADINATAKKFKVFPTELKNSLSGATITITASNSRMQLKWPDGTVLNRTLKLVSAKDGVYSLKVDGQHDLAIDAGQKDTLVLIEQPNSIVLTRVPPKPAQPKAGQGAAPGTKDAKPEPAKPAGTKPAESKPAQTAGAEPKQPNPVQNKTGQTAPAPAKK